MSHGQEQEVGENKSKEEIKTKKFESKERSLSEILNIIKQDTQKKEVLKETINQVQEITIKQQKEKNQKTCHPKRSYNKKLNAQNNNNKTISAIEQINKKNKADLQKSKKRVYTKRTDQKVCRWTSDESSLYVKFIEMYLDIMRDTGSKRNKKIFLLMSKFIGTKTACQCRSHHQKFFKKVISMLTADPNQSGNYSREDKRKMKKKIKRKEKEREQAVLLSKMMFDENNPLGIGNKANQGQIQTSYKVFKDENIINKEIQNVKAPSYQPQMLQSDFSPLFGPHNNPSPSIKPLNTSIQQQNVAQLFAAEQEMKLSINNNSIVQQIDLLQEKNQNQNDQEFKDYPIQSPLLNYQQDVHKVEIKNEFEMFRKMSLDNFGYSMKLQEQSEDLFLQNYINQ